MKTGKAFSGLYEMKQGASLIIRNKEAPCFIS